MHAKGATLVVISNSLDHRPEDVWIDLPPVQAADMQQIGPCNLAEYGDIGRSRKQSAVYIGKYVRPARYASSAAIFRAGIHRLEDGLDHDVCI
ncbi:hypothetical protein D9M68_802360 [compost metagenome]